MKIEDLAITKAIDAEIADETFTCTHGKAYCYGKGCRGPLCTYANRVRKGFASDVDDLIEYRLKEYLEGRQ